MHVNGVDMTGARAYKYALAGVAHAPEGRSVFGTLTVSRPLPRLFTFSVAVATPRWHSSTDRNTVVVSGCKIG